MKNRKAVSEGQTLAIAYSYIGSLFDESSFRFPFVIDSPAVSLDLSVRKKYQKYYLLYLNSWLYLLFLSEVANFADSYYDFPDVAFYTIEAKDGPENAVCTIGKDYFDLFQKDE